MRPTQEELEERNILKSNVKIVFGNCNQFFIL